jgi:hypothetical protein
VWIVQTLGDEHRGNEVVRGQVRLGDQLAQRRGAAESTRSLGRKHSNSLLPGTGSSLSIGLENIKTFLQRRSASLNHSFALLSHDYTSRRPRYHHPGLRSNKGLCHGARALAHE